MNFILIDGSYYCFYRFYAISAWFKRAWPDVPLTSAIENIDFVETYMKTFVAKIKELPKKLRIENPIIIVAKDCPREKIWRNAYFSKYKEKRVYDDSFMGGPFFKMAYEGKELFRQAGVKAILFHPQLEADDCIAITARHIYEKYPDAKIAIITSDTDYLQLICDRISLYNLKHNPVNTSKNSCGNAEKDLFCKILMGDKSDNIPGVFAKCGIKTALKCFDDRTFFERRLLKENSGEKFKRNTKLIDFTQIPSELVEEFKSEILWL